MVSGSASFLELIPSASDPMARVNRLVEAAAADASPVFFAGESGSGKSYQAARIHERSARASAPFVHVFAATVGPDVLQSMVRSARGGVLFIDEIEELSAAAQARLFQYLEAQGRSDEVEARIIVATTRDPAPLAVSASFRRDLFFRLTELLIVLPPLRARRADIGTLARGFIAEAAARVGRPPPTLTTDAEAALTSYAWPGNVRQLRSVLVAATIGADEGVLRRESLWLPALPATSVEPVPPSRRAAAGEPRPVRSTIDRHRVAEALAHTGGNQSAAALYLGISRRTLINRIEQFGLPRPRKL